MFPKQIFCEILVIFIILIVNINCATITPQIVGGEISPMNYKYQVSIQIPTSDRKNWTHNCGGSIIGNIYVLTAAHCLLGYTTTDLSVLAGIKNLDEPGSRHSVKKIKYHKKFSFILPRYDIGIITVTEEFTFSDKIGSIGFNNVFVPEETKCILTGWGQTYNKQPAEPAPKNLKRIQLNTISNSECKKSWSLIIDANVCTLKSRDQAACFGDSGGPLAKLDENIIVGIVSYGTNPCGQGKPDVFTRVSEFTEWIRNNMV